MSVVVKSFFLFCARFFLGQDVSSLPPRCTPLQIGIWVKHISELRKVCSHHPANLASSKRRLKSHEDPHLGSWCKCHVSEVHESAPQEPGGCCSPFLASGNPKWQVLRAAGFPERLGWGPAARGCDP